jgi:glycosyltransferase involved in cell wall biosynthesis
MSAPQLSVVIPVYKTEEHLARCVDSVLGQDLEGLELILVDDGSPDNCPALCDAYALRDARVRVLHQTNIGLAGARNSGLRAARGEYVAFLDSDDWIQPDAYATLYAKAVEQDADIVFCQARYFDDSRQAFCEADDASSLPLFRNERFAKAFNWQDIGVENIFSYASFVVAWNKICKRGFLESINADFPTGLIYEDNPFYFHTIFAAKRLSVVRERLVTYRINRRGSIIRNVEEGEDPHRSIHILAILAEIERRVRPFLPERGLSAFRKYALREIFYKYRQIPSELTVKYLQLAKGLLPAAMYWKLRVLILAEALKNHSVRSILRPHLAGSGREISLTVFGVRVFEVKKLHAMPGEYGSITAMGMDGEMAATLRRTWPGNAFSLCNEADFLFLREHLGRLLTCPDQKRIPRIVNERTRCGATNKDADASPGLNELESISGLLSITHSMLLLDFSSRRLEADDVKCLFYALNCIYYDKAIHFLKIITGGSPAQRHSPVKGLDIVQSSQFPQVLNGRSLQKHHRYLRVSLLNLPVLVARRK